ncbi:MAG: Hydrogenase, partial [Bacteroidota bacterium]|nr:Hydrogenase [Bacteroidota bacterium]
MNKIETLDEFILFRHRVQSEGKIKFQKPTLVVCAGTGGQASGSNDVV